MTGLSYFTVQFIFAQSAGRPLYQPMYWLKLTTSVNSPSGSSTTLAVGSEPPACTSIAAEIRRLGSRARVIEIMRFRNSVRAGDTGVSLAMDQMITLARFLSRWLSWFSALASVAGFSHWMVQ